MTDVAKIADSLTRAQCRWLDEAWYGAHGWRITGYRKKACDLGLCEPGTSRLTTLGQSVRNHLQGKSS